MASKSSQAQALMATSRGVTSQPMQRQGFSQGGNWASMYGTSLPRTFDTFRSGDFSPMEPIYPIAIDIPEPPSGRPRPRRYQFPVGWNLPVGQPGTEGTKLANFQVLRDMAEIGSIPRRAVEICKADIQNLTWNIVPTLNAEKAMQGSPSKRKDFELRRSEMMHWMMYEVDPNYDGFYSWLNALVEDMLVLDAVAIHPLPTRGKGSGPVGSSVAALEILDGSTIRPLLNTWGSRPAPPQPAYQQCFSPDTEVLTKDGWKLFQDLRDVDEIATRSSSGVIEYQKPDHIIRQPYSGSMVRFHGKMIDLLVTPDHRMLVDHLPRELGGNGNRWSGSKESFVPAGDLLAVYERVPRSPHDSSYRRARFTSQGEWEAPDLEKFVIPVSIPEDSMLLGPSEISGDDFAAFMGMWLAEGCLTRVRGVLKSEIPIAQSRGSKGHGDYRDLLERVFPGRVRESDAGFVVSGRALARWLEQFGYAQEKFIPAEILGMSKRQLAIFWHYYWLGDGRKSDGAIITASKCMADDLQEVALKIGMSASVRPHSSGEAWVVSPHKTKWRGWNAEAVDYEGEVVCASVPNGTLYVRRNGYASWQGNCVWGVPRVDLMDIINLGPGATIEDLKELNPVLEELMEPVDQWAGDQLIYLRANQRAWTPYGFSAMEQCLLPASIMMARQTWQWEYYRSGSMPAVFIDPGDMIATPTEARELQDAINMLGGDLGAKHQVIVLPPGAKTQPQKDIVQGDDFDVLMITEVAMAFGLQINDLGLMPKMANMTSPAQAKRDAQVATELTTRRSTLPRARYIERFMTGLLQNTFGQEDMRFSSGVTDIVDDPDSVQERWSQRLHDSAISIDEYRMAVGMEPIGEPWATVPLAFGSNSVMPLPVEIDMVARESSPNTATNGASVSQGGGNPTREPIVDPNPHMSGETGPATAMHDASRAVGKALASKNPVKTVDAEDVKSYLEESYPGSALDWVDHMTWSVKDVPTKDISVTGPASKEDLKGIKKKVKQIKKGKPINPVVLVDPHEDGLMQVADGHHRVTAAVMAKVDAVPAWVGEPKSKKIGDWRRQIMDMQLVRAVKNFGSGMGFVPFDLGPPSEPITVAGICLMAADTGRVLLLQRSLEDDDQANAGKWEFPGGHLEMGESPTEGAVREWQEEVGIDLPADATILSQWDSANGMYRCFLMLTASEDDIAINASPQNRTVVNPDDPSSDRIETVAWWDTDQLMGNPATRSEVKDMTPWDVVMLAKQNLPTL